MGKQPPAIHLLAMSGSLRATSLNTALLRAAVRLAPSGVTISLYDGLGRLPLFNPDLESAEPAEVTELRRQVRTADGLLIASPEYAHGITGAMKNALDWLVGGEEFVEKPVAAFNASPRAMHAYAALLETVKTMSAHIVSEACVALPLLGSGLDAEGIVAHPELSRSLAAALDTFAGAIREFRNEGSGSAAPYAMVDTEMPRNPS